MKQEKKFEVIIIGGSYSGLAAAMTLGRSLRKTLVIDSGLPCNRQTPHSHNFLTQDGKTPREIADEARKQVKQYETVSFFEGLAVQGQKTDNGFLIRTESGEEFLAKKLIFATGIKDILPDIPGFKESWGISLIHCPYCHGYEVRNEKTGIIGNGEYGYEFSAFISNWTSDLTLYSNGPSTLSQEQTDLLKSHGINIIEDIIERLEHDKGYVKEIVFKNGKTASVKAVYTKPDFKQHCQIPEALGCELNEDAYLKVDAMQRSTVPGIYACGDNTTRFRTVANAVAMGTAAAAMLNREMVMEKFGKI